ncbi:hypothetical protein FRB97_002840, partial [Tulasnella sp. 331]
FEEPALASQPAMAGKQLTGAQAINITDVLPSVAYNGCNLNNCDYSGIRIVISPSPPTASFTAGVVCNGKDFPAMISTAFSMDATSIFNTSLGTIWGTLAPGASNLAGAVESLLMAALSDIGDQAVSFMNDTGNVPTGTSYPAPAVLCYNQLLGDVDESCTRIPPALSFSPAASPARVRGRANVDSSVSEGMEISASPDDGYQVGPNAVVYNGPISKDGNPVAVNTTLGIGNWMNQNVTLNNAAQLIIAAIRLDIGNIFSNNLLVSPNTLNPTIASQYQNSSLNTTAPSTLYSALNRFNTGNQNWTVLNIPGDQLQPATIATQYLCHVPQRKPLGQVIISVLVATLSIFSSGWGLFMVFSTCVERRIHKKANVCEEHSDLEARLMSELQGENGAIPLLKTHSGGEKGAYSEQDDEIDDRRSSIS